MASTSLYPDFFSTSCLSFLTAGILSIYPSILAVGLHTRTYMGELSF